MIINEELIYTGENFNIVFSCSDDMKEALDIIKEVFASYEADVEIDPDNYKVYVSEGEIGNYNTAVHDVCKAIASAMPKCNFYGHAFYDDDDCGYESCGDYIFENGKLHIELIESENGPGVCPECGEQVVCFDEFDSDIQYCCEDCEIEITADDLFDGVLPVKTIFDYDFIE